MNWNFRTRLAVCAALSLLGVAVNRLVKREVRARADLRFDEERCILEPPIKASEPHTLSWWVDGVMVASMSVWSDRGILCWSDPTHELTDKQFELGCILVCAALGCRRDI